MKTIYKTLTMFLLTVVLISNFKMTAMAEGRYKEVVCGIIDTTVAISESDIRTMCEEACKDTNIDPAIMEALCYEESRFNPAAESNVQCVGLCQMSTVFHIDRAETLGITDFFDPYSNIRLSVHYMEELLNTYGNYELALMCYNMGPKRAKELYNEGTISKYASNIVANAEKIRNTDIDPEEHVYKGEIPFVFETKYDVITMKTYELDSLEISDSETNLKILKNINNFLCNYIKNNNL